jgi:hypothetical protein
MNPSAVLRKSLADRIVGRLNLRFPGLFLLLAGLTIADVLIPDFIPLVDEIGLALITLLLASWKKRRNVPPGGGRAAT